MREFGAALIALGWILGKALRDYCTQAGMDRHLEFAGRNRVLMDDLVNDRGHILACKRPLAGRHLVKHDAKTEQVSAAV